MFINMKLFHAIIMMKYLHIINCYMQDLLVNLKGPLTLICQKILS